MNKGLPPSHLPNKWFDALRVDVGDRRRAREIRREIGEAPPPEVFGVTDAARTEFEERVIRLSAEALRAFLAANGLAGRPVEPDRVHLLTPAEYAAKIGINGPDGLTMYGHAYIQRTDDEVRLIHMVTHELVHQAAYLSLKVVMINEPATGETVTRSHAARGGLVTFCDSDPQRPQFQGLNEGATELVAHEVRRNFIGRCRQLDAGVRDKLLCFWAYSCWCLLTARLIRAAAGNAGDTVACRQLLYRDYFLGTSDFRRALERSVPGARAVLRTAETTAAGAQNAAECLGFPEIAERISQLRRRSASVSK